MKWLISLCHRLVGSYGLAIVLFTLLTKVLLFPVSLWTHRNSLQVVSMMPTLNKLKIKYYGDKDAIAEQTQKLYKQRHYHPLVSTVPMLIQLALLIGVIGAVKSLLASTESILSVYPAQTGGITLLMPVAAGAAALILGLAQNRINPLQREQTPAEQWMTNGLSIAISLALGVFVPVGVGLYWICSNLFTILQQLVLNAVVPPEKHIDYPDLRASQEKLQTIEALTPKVSREDKQRERADYKRFFSVANKHLVFYSEGSGFYKYFETTMDYLLSHSNVTIHYVTSDPKDQIFELAKRQPQIHPYYIGEKKLITLMMKMDADIVVMTMPDLENFHIKRSYVRQDVEYIYLFHWCTSVHMVIREGSLDHYDTVFCPGPHQMDEIRATERMYGLPEKKLIDTGYGVIENLTKAYKKMDKPKGTVRQILIAPSYQTDNIMDSCINELLKQLLGSGNRIILRPHPQYIRRYPQKIERFQQRYYHEIERGDFEFQTDFSSGDTVYRSDVVITDWSTISYEFSLTTGKPTLFINTPMKVVNPNYVKYPMLPLDITLRDKIGHAVELGEMKKVPSILRDMIENQQQWKEQIMTVKHDLLPKFGHSGELGGQYILQKLLRRQKREGEKP